MNSTEARRQALIPFALGFFSIAAQALLFRWFFTAFESNELGISAFFFSWLLWVAAGALAARLPSLRRRAGKAFGWWIWIYIPAFLLQYGLILNARTLCGVESYEAFPFARLFAASLLINAPVSFVTGLLFTLACRWLVPSGDRSVTRVYIAEALGSVLGGIWATALLAVLPDAEGVALLTILALVFLHGLYRAGSGPARTALMAAALILSVFLPRAGEWRGLQAAQARWNKIVPGTACDGRFTTPQNIYLHGMHNGQLNVVCGNTIIETIPDHEAAGELIAIHLAQKPDAKSVLVIGEGSLALAQRLLILPQIKQVVWLPADPAYGRRLTAALPDEMKPDLTRLMIPGEDIQRHLARTRNLYDLVILHLPDPVALDLHRFFTQQFFRDLQSRLASEGVVSLRTSGGENFLGSERIYLGATVLATLESVFPNVVIKPGDETWFIASASDGLSQNAQELAERFKKVDGADGIWPAEGLLSLYPGDRAAFQMGKYREAIRTQPAGSLIGTADSPRALFHTLQLLTREISLNSRVMPLLLRLSHKGWLLFVIAILLYSILRRIHSAAGPTAFDGRYLVFSTGLANLAISIVLMVLYEGRFGSIYLHIGILTAMFMLGVWLGSVAGRKIFETHARRLVILILAQAVLCILIPGISRNIGRPLFMLLFLVCGAFGGACIPAAARIFGCTGMADDRMGAAVEMTDHLGGAAGAVITGLVLLPVAGIRRTLLILAVLLLSNLVSLSPSRSARSTPRRPAWIFVLIWTAALLLFGTWLLRGSHTPDNSPRHHLITARGSGYGGPLIMSLTVNTNGVLENIRIVQHSETPSYFQRVAPWIESLAGKNIFSPTFRDEVDTVTGATATSAGIRDALAAAGQDFLARAEGRAEAEQKPAAPTEWKSRKADIQKIKDMIGAGKLSGREAMHYTPVENP
ncbi:MAG: FMN-binding protein [Kiritimatiellia bacterium]